MPHRPLRALHVVHSLNRGGVETWLRQIIERLDRSQVAIDVAVQTDPPGGHADAVRSVGAQIFTCPAPNRPWKYARSFRAILHDAGPYDVVHCHLHHWCGFVLRLAYQSGVPVRIAHSRNAIPTRLGAVGPARAAYFWLMKRWLNRYMTHGLAVSRAAGESLFGARWGHDARCAILPSAIDLTPFEQVVDRQAVRRELGLPDDALVVGHVGRFVHQKNHFFLIDVFEKMAQHDDRLWLLLVGSGPLEARVRRAAKRLGIEKRVVFAGEREDVPRLMLGAMDVLALPSRWEGLPRVVNEAQAAGRPVVMADHLSDESTVLAGLIRRLPLTAPSAEWGRALWEAISRPAPLSREEALQTMTASAINIDRNAPMLARLYDDAIE